MDTLADATTPAAIAEAARRLGCWSVAFKWARRVDLAVGLFDLRTSADTAGDPSRVVAYGAFALTPGPEAR